jgi:hypothetical protein
MLKIPTPEPGIQPAADSLEDAWAFVDKVYCISLDHRGDRQQQAMDQFRRVGLANRIEFMIGTKHPTNAEQGNYIAQMNCLRAGVDGGARTILVFEDDILFDRFSPQQLNRAMQFMAGDSTWKMFFLGCLVKSSRKTRYPSILNVRFRSLSHAYVIRRDFAQRLLQIPWPGRCFDDLICSLNDPGMYAIHPSFAFQSNSRTDNDKQILFDRVRRILGGLRFLQKLNEFSSLHFRRLVLIHAGIIFLMIAAAIALHLHNLSHG